MLKCRQPTLAENFQEEVETQTLELEAKTTEAMEAKEYAELSSQEALRQKAKAETARLDAEELREALSRTQKNSKL